MTNTFESTKNQIIRKLDAYINNRFINIFSNHHHNERAINTKNYVQMSNTIECIKAILENELYLFDERSSIENSRSSLYYNKRSSSVHLYNSSKYARELKNKNQNTSTYFKAIKECYQIYTNYESEQNTF
ncbi:MULTISPECIES: hypothetical protein [unclassified Francisella]|uniref:hypothetical protein n=1 Tax=unclassified Francisella TaxID=2610885 RepID=UPI002E2F8082|nr:MULTISPECIES: hypothetical protein [unclassified Francisella]MED7818899.1 hypothetical protein [Francisella sp. 19S2-4]MED7829736.1 hypothetical protein [Francisella sp. 19S2-10]